MVLLVQAQNVFEDAANEFAKNKAKIPQLVYQQPVQQEMPNLSDDELRILAIPLICNNWESNWRELMQLGPPDKKAYPNSLNLALRTII